MVGRLFLAVPRGCLLFVIVVFPDHTHLLFLYLSISNEIVSTKNYDKRENFDFEVVNLPFLDGHISRSTSYGVYISQLIRFAGASSLVVNFNAHNKLLSQKLLKQGYHKLRKTFFLIV